MLAGVRRGGLCDAFVALCDAFSLSELRAHTAADWRPVLGEKLSD